MAKLASEEFRFKYQNINKIKDDLTYIIDTAIKEIDETDEVLKSYIDEITKTYLNNLTMLFQKFDVNAEENLQNLIKTTNFRGLEVLEKFCLEINSLKAKDLLFQSIDIYLEKLVINENMNRYTLFFQI